MDPNQIELIILVRVLNITNLRLKLTSYDREILKNIAKSFCKLYYKQQETMSVIGIPNAAD